jgi:DNA ligase-1
MKVNNFPTLYKTTSTGAIQQWRISTIEYDDHAVIHTAFGQVGVAEQTTDDLIKVGKNIGKANETHPFQQAYLEAESKHTGKLKKGYVTSYTDASLGKIDAIIEGGVLPMLAHKFSKHGHKIKYPALVQPKLDGIRCIAILKNGKCALWSRTRKPITSVPHIVKELESGGHQDMILDGELYNHDYRDNFEHIVHLVTQEIPIAGHEAVQYHVYDVISVGDNNTLADENRQDWLKQGFNSGELDLPLVHVETVKADSIVQVNNLCDHYLELGYEGCMVRNMDGKYVNKRSYDLLKVKKFDDAEFQIIGIEEGRGKLTGHVGAFICETSDGVCFKAKMSGDTGMLKKYFQNASLWKDRELVVQYQGMTGKNGVPRFPVGLRIKEKV